MKEWLLRCVGWGIFTFFILIVHTYANEKVLGFSYSGVHTLKEKCEATIPRNQTCEVVISLQVKEVSE
jgi:hypothetical protein